MNAQNQNITSLSVHVNRAAVQTASIGQAIPLRSHLFQAQDRPSLTPPWLTSHSHNNIMWPPTWTGSDDARCVSVVNINSIFVVRLTLSAPFYETGGEWIKKLFERLVEGGIFLLDSIYLTKKLHVNTHPVFNFAHGGTPNTNGTRSLKLASAKLQRLTTLLV